MIGASQGGLVGRYLVEECELGVYIKKLITLGTPHMGISRVPSTFIDSLEFFYYYFVQGSIYNSYIQGYIGPAGYIKDLTNYKSYLKGATFLPDLNNERPVKNLMYKQRMTQLEQFVMIKFAKDTVIYPK